MIPKLIFASHNSNKTKEIAALLDGLISIVSLNDIGYVEEIVESGLTLNENAFIKANAIHKACELNCFADDTGLLVESLNDEPGVYSARYAGPEKNDLLNNKKLLDNLIGLENRKAKFVTVIHLIWENEHHIFEGKLEGTIALEPAGNEGFGYDPIFYPIGSNRSLAQMSLEEKNMISHRGKAFNGMLQFLKSQIGK